MSKSISGSRNLVARVFLAGLLFGSVGGLAQHAWGAWRSYPADSHCMKESFATVGWSCGTNIGSDFLAANLGTAEIDFMYSNTATGDSIYAYACRDSWNLTTSYCGTSAFLDLKTLNTTPIITYLTPDTAVMKAGSQYDYRYVTINATQKTTTIDPKGVYLSGT